MGGQSRLTAERFEENRPGLRAVTYRMLGRERETTRMVHSRQ